VVRYRRLSLGLLTIEDTLRATVEAGHSIYDFTIGDYPWKLQFGAASLPMHEWVHARSIRGQLSLFGTDVIRNVKRSLKTLVKKQA
jgi:CelD/BcsL family acetyltransferase involved in cellulose biosynthesis